MHTTSSNATGISGQNGLLIESDTADATVHVVIDGWRVDDAAEHGFRIGGSFRTRDVTHINCSSRNSGNVAAATGGSGFKCLGATSTSTAHLNIRYINCLVEDAAQNTTTPALNHSGFFIGLTEHFSIINPIVRKRDATNSAFHGIDLVGVRNGNIIGMDISDTESDAINGHEDDAGGFGSLFSRITFTGGTILNSGAAAFRFAAGNLTFRRIAIQDVQLDNTASFDIESTETTGTFTGCTARYTTWTPGAATNISGCDEWVIHGLGQVVGGIGNAKNGSLFQSWTNGNVQARLAGAWTALS